MLGIIDTLSMLKHNKTRKLNENIGFSFTDIMVALLVFASISGVLFKQHWLSLQYNEQLRLKNLALIELDNISEYKLCGEKQMHVSSPFKLQWLDENTVKLIWFIPGKESENSLQRTWH